MQSVTQFIGERMANPVGVLIGALWFGLMASLVVAAVLACLQLWLWFIGMLVTTLPWHVVGLMGQPRRMAYYLRYCATFLRSPAMIGMRPHKRTRARGTEPLPPIV